MATKKDNLQIYVTDIAGTIRSVEGSTEKINAQDFSDRIRAIGKTGDTGGKTTPSFTSGRANKIIISRKSEYNSFYPRWVRTVFNAHLFTNNSVINVDTNTWSFGLPTTLISEEDEQVDDFGDLIAAEIEGASNYLIVFYKANNPATNSYSIVGKILQENEKGVLSFVSGLIKTIGGAGSLHQPFVFDNYVYYCEESGYGTRQDIKRAKINYTIVDGIVQDFNLDDPEIVISGEDNLDDSGNNQLSAYLGSPAVARLADGNLIIVYDSDVNKDLNYPHTIQYSYSTDDGATWEEGRTLFKVLGYNNKAPYIVVDSFGRVAISYHTNNEYIENSYGTDTIFDYVFKAFISSGTIYCGDTLTPVDFIEIPTRRNQADEWTGGYGSLAIINGEVTPVYAYGPYNDNQGTIIDTIEASSAKVEQVKESSGLVVYAHENYTEKTIAAEVQAIRDSIVRRNSSGFVYGSTATNLDPMNEPTILTTKAYVANFGKANYLPLRGGTISGNLSVSGNLIVAGESTILEAEHLKVKDAIIETNSEGNNIPTISGLAIHKNTTDTYIIGYDPANDSVKLGFGKQDANKNWVFKTGEGNPIATRADAKLMTNNGFVVWNKNKTRLETTMITGLVGEGEAQSVRYNQDEGFTYRFGCLLETTYTNSDFDLVLSVPLVSGEGITFAPTNDGKRLEVKLDTAYTDEKYVAKGSTRKAVYARDYQGNEGMTPYAESADPFTLVRRAAGGVVRVGTAVEDSDAMPKKQVEDGFVAKVTTGNRNQAYTVDTNNQQTMIDISINPDSWQLARRYEDGRLQVGTPVGINDATTKAYVDNLNTITITAGA